MSFLRNAREYYRRLPKTAAFVLLLPILLGALLLSLNTILGFFQSWEYLQALSHNHPEFIRVLSTHLAVTLVLGGFAGLGVIFLWASFHHEPALEQAPEIAKLPGSAGLVVRPHPAPEIRTITEASLVFEADRVGLLVKNRSPRTAIFSMTIDRESGNIRSWPGPVRARWLGEPDTISSLAILPNDQGRAIIACLESRLSGANELRGKWLFPFVSGGQASHREAGYNFITPEPSPNFSTAEAAAIVVVVTLCADPVLVEQKIERRIGLRGGSAYEWVGEQWQELR